MLENVTLAAGLPKTFEAIRVSPPANRSVGNDGSYPSAPGGALRAGVSAKRVETKSGSGHGLSRRARNRVAGEPKHGPVSSRQGR